ncbi:transcriptional regulator, LysR family [Piscinibacter sakaiensis]|uniref:Transcriptional regulator, LysR family n=1 Tax=Piscinibacter sakaiensis TaxID=1547922 RepID=A0A0K8P755_PISS1|nr:transcriptional regulator, LysR family [Piscinibacter sakaiensis]
MELRHLRYFCALAQHLNFTVAAESLHVAQSTLSHQIKQLEEELGTRLLSRTRGRVVNLTAAGSTFAVFANNALREVDEGIWRLKPEAADLQGSFRIGTIQTANLVQVPRCVLAFHERFPRVHVSVMELSNDAVLEALGAGEIDFGVTNAPVVQKALHFEPLFSEQLVLVVAKTHRLASRRSIRMVELHRQPIVQLSRGFAMRKMLEEQFQSAHAEPHVMVELNSIPPMLEMVAAGSLAAILPASAQNRSELVSVRIESPTPTRTPGMAWKKRAGSTPFVRAFAELLRSEAAQAGGGMRRGRRTRISPADS